jgi:diguanylate cyclase (GGDEF)-like protein/PAS domain S-box-containing protein
MWRLASGPRARVVMFSIALFAAVFVIRMTIDAAGTGVGFLYVVPIVILAVEFGRTAGLASGLLALGLFAIWAQFQSPEQVDAVGYLSRATVFLLVGSLTGRMAERLRTANQRMEAGARHFEVARDLLCTSNFEGYMVHLNGSWEKTLGWTAEELMARPFLDFVHPDDRERTERESALVTTGDFTASFTNRYRAKDGSWHWIEWASKADMEHRLVYASARDVTARRLEDRARREAEERFRRAFEDSAVGMAVVGVEGEKANLIVDANESLARMIGMSVEELVGTSKLSTLAHPDDVARIAEGMYQLHDGRTSLFRCEFRIVRPDGRRLWVDMTTSLVRDDDGEPLYRLSQVVDIDARKQVAEQLQHLADHDALSGVFNRRRFEQELERELGHAAARGGRGAVLLLDVDRFKEINDTLGHAVGDAVISRLGETFSARLRTMDVVARLGGDEFAVLLRRVEPDDAVQVADGLRELALERLSDLPLNGLAAVTLSVGVATFGNGEEIPTPDDLLSQADHAMYDAKRAGGNRVSGGVRA